MIINVLRDLLAIDQTWANLVHVILGEEDDGSLHQLSLSDIPVVDLSNFTVPNARRAIPAWLAAPFEPANEGRCCCWGLDAVKAMQVAFGFRSQAFADIRALHGF